MPYKRCHVRVSDCALLGVCVEDSIRQMGGRALHGCRCLCRGSAAVVLHKLATHQCVPPLLR
eukprot:3160-Amphidinium_carterae.1